MRFIYTEYSTSNLKIPKMALLINLLFLLLSSIARANVEKTIFPAPDTVRVPSQHPTLSDLYIDSLTPQNSVLRASLSAQFPNSSHATGKATWLLLDDLNPGQRYEVRVCWAATQPTAFKIKTYELDTVFSTPELITSLGEYSLPRQPSESTQLEQQPRIHQSTTSHNEEKRKESSLLFLQILAAADYFTTDATLMSNVPPVDVDIILDPFLLNLLPRSLLPTVCYIVAVTLAAYFLSALIVSWFEALIAGAGGQQKKKMH
ncbi:hypothetical protein B0H66DRAFT_564498 [Apodospora peruviana]|uniref:Uncharacterized protein n=1 Tax=Apodospora peruviana TaxID=516989 RepID=A0AAE0HYB8_9PEZI|nr:hypothetical protein B0H66DRAFT_564498 [Apodospora peruviana]